MVLLKESNCSWFLTFSHVVHELHSQAHQLGPTGSITVYYALPLSMISLDLNTHKISYSYKILLISWGFTYSIMEWILLLQKHHQFIRFYHLSGSGSGGSSLSREAQSSLLFPSYPRHIIYPVCPGSGSGFPSQYEMNEIPQWGGVPWVTSTHSFWCKAPVCYS